MTEETASSSQSLSETPDLASADIEKQAAWVNSNMADVVQRATSTMQIAETLRDQKMIHKETYERIKVAGTRMDKTRELYSALNCPTVAAAFYRILHETDPAFRRGQDVIKETMKKHKSNLRERFGYEYEGTATDAQDVKLLEQIYTELHIVQGQSRSVNTEHEIWEIQDKIRCESADTAGTKINCNDIFRSPPEEGRSSGGSARPIRTVMTEGIAGIGKTVSVKKFILDWANGEANQDLDFIAVLTFRELNLVTDDPFSLETLVKEFHPEFKNIAVAEVFDTHKVMIIFDGLDESQLQLNFKKTKRLTDATKEESVDTIVTNIIRKNLLPSALVWITSRPGAVKRIPREFVHQWTEVRGFNETQKVVYFRKRIGDEAVAERIIEHIKRSQSLFIMCHIPIFCWIAAKVLEYLLPKLDTKNEQIPTTLTEMYTHFLSIQMQVAEKYSSQNEQDVEEIFEANEELIFKLGKLAFEQLEKSKIIFTASDLRSYGIDINTAAVCSGLCTEIMKQENVFNNKKLYCFVHLTVQEYFAALFVYQSFARKKIDSTSLKDFMLKESEEELKDILDADPVDETLDVLIEIVLANSTQRQSGELDMFLRFLIGMSLETTQELLHGLIQQEEDHSAVADNIKTSLLELDLFDCSPERCLNLVHCLIELKDSSLHDTVCQYLMPSHAPETQLSPVQCSALADSILMSKEPLDEFNLANYRTSAKGTFRLIPAVRNCRKATLSGVSLNTWICEAVSSALRMANSVLTELHLLNNDVLDKGVLILTDALNKSQCKLEALSLAGTGLTESMCEQLASAINGISPNLRELELSGDILRESLGSVLSVGLLQPKLERLRLNRNDRIGQICKQVLAAFTSSLCCLRELDLSYSCLTDSGLDDLCTGLMSKTCVLEVLSLSHNRVTEKGCAALASALGSGSSHLRELDLSYNDLHDTGAEKLCDPLTKPQCRLESLRLDANTAGPQVILSKGNKMASHHDEKQPYPDHAERFEGSQVLCEQGLSGRHYWEAECDSADVGVAYRSMPRTGDCTSDYGLGYNEKSWCWMSDRCFKHNNSRVDLLNPIPSRSTIGVYLDWAAGVLSFYEVDDDDELTLIYTVCTTFTEPLHPGFSVYHGSVCLREIKQEQTPP